MTPRFSSTPTSLSFFFFFFNDTATTEIYTLSLHDALPISLPAESVRTSRAIALAITSTLPVFTAGFTKTDDEEKSPYTVQPLLHCEQKKHEIGRAHV